jgi:hypothetical protein
MKKNKVEGKIKECIKKFGRKSKPISKLSEKEIQTLCDEY